MEGSPAAQREMQLWHVAQLARELLRQQKPGEALTRALQCFNQADAELGPESPVTYYAQVLLAEVYLALGQPVHTKQLLLSLVDTALEEAEQLRARDAVEVAVAAHRLAHVACMRMGEYVAARDIATRMVLFMTALRMNALSAHELCAEAHAALHDTEAAVAARRSVLRAAEDAADSQRVAWALIRLGEAHVQLGDFAAASAQFLDAFLRLEGDDLFGSAVAALGLGAALGELRRWREAEVVLGTALRLRHALWQGQQQLAHSQAQHLGAEVEGGAADTSTLRMFDLDTAGSPTAASSAASAAAAAVPALTLSASAAAPAAGPETDADADTPTVTAADVAVCFARLSAVLAAQRTRCAAGHPLRHPLLLTPYRAERLEEAAEASHSALHWAAPALNAGAAEAAASVRAEVATLQASVLAGQGAVADATDALSRAVDEATQALGQEHAVTLSLAGRLADALAAQGEADRAAALLHVIVRRSDELQAHDPPAFAALLNNLGNLQRQLGAQQEALQSYRRALQCMSRAVGEQHRYTATLQCNYATALITSGGDAGEARRVLLAAAATRVRAFGEHSGEAGACYLALCALHLQRGDRTSAAQWLRQAKHSLSPGDPRYGELADLTLALATPPHQRLSHARLRGPLRHAEAVLRSPTAGFGRGWLR